jgi:protein-tyrosine phosphatase
VSRSATLAIAYLMWRLGLGYDEAFQTVKAGRGVANPNIGFICQVCAGQV